MTIVTSDGKLYVIVKCWISAKKFANTTKIPVFKNWKKLILTVSTVLNSVNVSFLYFTVVKIKNCNMMKLKIDTKIDRPTESNCCMVLSVTESCNTANPY